MKYLSGPFSRLKPCKVLVAGDLILDAYTIGKAERISPEAPVAVVHVEKEIILPGGAGNAMLNLVSLGAHVIALGRVGCDGWGKDLLQALANEHIDTTAVIEQPNYRTPVKNRIVAGSQQIVRVDHEKIDNLPEIIEEKVIEALNDVLPTVDIIAVSDYGKGFLSRSFLNILMEKAGSLGISVIVDPKGTDFSKYFGATVIKPNLTEAYAAANLARSYSLDMAAKHILTTTEAKTVMITRSEDGISSYHSDGSIGHFPVAAREVKDVTGAGDTVLAMLTMALGCGLAFDEAVQLCNIAAGIAIEHFGCVRVSLKMLAQRVLEVDKNNKIFDIEHLDVLKHALLNKPYYLVSFPAFETITKEMYCNLQEIIQKHPSTAIIAYIDTPHADPLSIKMLSSLHEIDYILTDKQAANELLSSSNAR